MLGSEISSLINGSRKRVFQKFEISTKRYLFLNFEKKRWSDIFLKEGFARYYEYRGTDMIRPLWRAVFEFFFSFSRRKDFISNFGSYLKDWQISRAPMWHHSIGLERFHAANHVECQLARRDQLAIQWSYHIRKSDPPPFFSSVLIKKILIRLQ